MPGAMLGAYAQRNAGVAMHRQTDRRTNREASSPTGDISRFVTRTRTYGISIGDQP
jgi:hypothetical protein